MIRFFTRNEKGVLTCTTGADDILALDQTLNDHVLGCIANSQFSSNDMYAKVNPDALYLDADFDDVFENITNVSPVYFMNVVSNDVIEFLKNDFICFKKGAFIATMWEAMIDEDRTCLGTSENQMANHLDLYTAISNKGNIPMFLSHYQNNKKENIWYVYGVMSFNNEEFNITDGLALKLVEPPYGKDCYYSITWKEIKRIFHDIKPLYI